MSKYEYKKKPVVVEAFEWGGHRPSALDPHWLMNAYMMNLIHYETIEDECNIILIDTKEGTMRVNPNDYIIKGIQGELYPCKADIFHETYDKI